VLRTSLVSGAWAFAPESHSRWQLAQMPRIARVLLQQTHQIQGLHSRRSISPRRPIMENGHLWENPCSRRAGLPSANFDILRIACRHLNVRVWILMDRCCCVWRADDRSQGFSLVSLLGVVQLEPAPFAQDPTLLVVGKGHSVTGPLGGVLLPGYLGCPHRLRQEWEVFRERKRHERYRSKWGGEESRR